jgi:hypothetical protein
MAAIAGKALDALTPPEAEFLCREDIARTDQCLELGRSLHQTQPDPEACKRDVATCRAQRPAHPVATDCSGVTIAAPGTCGVKVEEYLTCLDTWHAVLTCNNAGYRLPAPPACVAIETACPDLGPFREEGEPPPCAADATALPDTNDDIVGLDTCRPKPARLVVLGDSIADCTSVSDDECTPYALAAYLRLTASPDLAFEMRAFGGAKVADLPGQTTLIEGGPGHVFVWIFAVGNDLLVGNVDYPGWANAFREVFEFFQDPVRFPDGATFLLNTQYSPFDECEGAEAEALIREVNQRLFLDVATVRTDTVAIDHFPDWLGHGRHANDASCPHCGADNTPWVFIADHPSAEGYAHMTEKWKLALDAMFQCAGNR